MDDLLVSMKCRIADWDEEDERGDWRAYQAEYADAADTIESLRAENARLREALSDRPTTDAYLATCRALRWRHAELRHHGIEPIRLTEHMPAEPPADDDLSAYIPSSAALSKGGERG